MSGIDYACGRGCTAMFISSRDRNNHEDTCRNLTVYGADPSGNTFTVLETYDPDEALKKLVRERGKHPRFVYGVHDTDEPEKGDVEAELEELHG